MSAPRGRADSSPAGDPASYTALLQHLLDQVPDAVFVKDLKGRYLLVNAVAARVIGRPVEAILGQDDYALFPVHIAQELQRHDREAATSHQRLTFEELTKVDGEVHTFLSTKTPYDSPNGVTVGVIGISRDITALKKAEAALCETERRYRDLIELAPDAIVVHRDFRLI